MKKLGLLSLRAAIIIALGALTLTSTQARAASAAEIDAASRTALHHLYAANPKARLLYEHAVGVLVFPAITKGGFIVALQHGEGALFINHHTAGYYNTVAGSYGFQAGIQQFGYALFFMNSKSLHYLKQTRGWELGSAPSLVVVDKSIAPSLSTNNLKKEMYAISFDRKGLMAGLGLQGSKITQIQPR